MTENVTVGVRIRPPNDTEIKNSDENIWSIDSINQRTVCLTPSCLCDFVENGKMNSSTNMKFNFCIF